jgi:glycosyltransferase involved in cell wall biosynthesis
MKLSVILPASNEEGWIGPCLDALLASDPVPGGAEVIVVANGCRDGTVAVARARAAVAEDAGWRLSVLDLAEGGKLNALNRGEAEAQGAVRVYLDADVVVSPGLMAALAQALAVAAPCYGSGRPVVAQARSGVTRAYARFWAGLPFAQSVAPGFGLFAVNAAGRARWGAFPDIISDDTFVRLQFTPEERVEVPHSYTWPMVEGFGALVRVRRRQDRGVAEIAARWPDLLTREGKAPLGAAGLAARALADPVGFGAYAAVSLAVRARRGDGAWVRGR